MSVYFVFEYLVSERDNRIAEGSWHSALTKFAKLGSQINHYEIALPELNNRIATIVRSATYEHAMNIADYSLNFVQSYCLNVMSRQLILIT